MPVQLETASGSLALAEQHVANMLANAAAFQAFVHADEAADAFERIHFDALPPPLNGQANYGPDELAKLRPFALVFTTEQNGFRRVRTATECYVESGSIVVQIERDVETEEARHNARLMRRFKNDLGDLIDELTELAYRSDYLAFDAIELVGHGRIEEDQVPTHGDHVCAVLLLTWGSSQ
jgi:hypothetical protein